MSTLTNLILVVNMDNLMGPKSIHALYNYWEENTNLHDKDFFIYLEHLFSFVLYTTDAEPIVIRARYPSKILLSKVNNNILEAYFCGDRVKALLEKVINSGEGIIMRPDYSVSLKNGETFVMEFSGVFSANIQNLGPCPTVNKPVYCISIGLENWKFRSN